MLKARPQIAAFIDEEVVHDACGLRRLKRRRLEAPTLAIDPDHAAASTEPPPSLSRGRHCEHGAVDELGCRALPRTPAKQADIRGEQQVLTLEQKSINGRGVEAARARERHVHGLEILCASSTPTQPTPRAHP